MASLLHEAVSMQAPKTRNGFFVGVCLRYPMILAISQLKCQEEQRLVLRRKRFEHPKHQNLVKIKMFCKERRSGAIKARVMLISNLYTKLNILASKLDKELPSVAYIWYTGINNHIPLYATMNILLSGCSNHTSDLYS